MLGFLGIRLLMSTATEENAILHPRLNERATDQCEAGLHLIIVPLRRSRYCSPCHSIRLPNNPATHTATCNRSLIGTNQRFQVCALERVSRHCKSHAKRIRANMKIIAPKVEKGRSMAKLVAVEES